MGQALSQPRRDYGNDLVAEMRDDAQHFRALLVSYGRVVAFLAPQEQGVFGAASRDQQNGLCLGMAENALISRGQEATTKEILRAVGLPTSDDEDGP